MTTSGPRAGLAPDIPRRQDSRFMPARRPDCHVAIRSDDPARFAGLPGGLAGRGVRHGRARPSGRMRLLWRRVARFPRIPLSTRGSGPRRGKLNEAGTAGWWLDLNRTRRGTPQTAYRGGGQRQCPQRVLPAVHSQAMKGSQLAVHPNQRPFVLTRCGPAGLQRYQAAIWTGDITSDYATLRSHPPEMLNSGLSGFTWWTCDTGGFLSGYYKDDQFGAHAVCMALGMHSPFSVRSRARTRGASRSHTHLGVGAELIVLIVDRREKTSGLSHVHHVEAREPGVEHFRGG